MSDSRSNLILHRLLIIAINLSMSSSGNIILYSTLNQFGDNLLHILPTNIETESGS